MNACEHALIAFDILVVFMFDRVFQSLGDPFSKEKCDHC